MVGSGGDAGFIVTLYGVLPGCCCSAELDELRGVVSRPVAVITAPALSCRDITESRLTWSQAAAVRDYATARMGISNTCMGRPISVAHVARRAEHLGE